MLPNSALDLAATAADQLSRLTGRDHELAVVLGSGWRGADLGTPQTEVAFADLPGFAPPTVPGHGATIESLDIAGRRTLIFTGRTHLYEGHGLDAVAHSVRTAAAAGCHTIVLTNGCGSLQPQWPPGTPVLIADHLNLTARSPLTGPEFVDLTDLYSSRLRARCRANHPDLVEGVYAQMPGPHYETPAEVRMARILGADLVGMSTALEAIAARACGLEVLGLSLVTNFAAGLDGPLSHQEVLSTGESAAARCGDLLRDVLTAL